MVDATPAIRVQPRDIAIFLHVLRYGLAEQEVVHRMFYEDQKPEAARRTLRRLKDAGYLSYQSDRWPNGAFAPAGKRLFSYYRLRPEAVVVLEGVLGVAAGFYGHASAPLPADMLTKRYAVYAFCCMNGASRRVLLQHEFDGHFAQYAKPEVRSWPYYFEKAAERYILRFLDVDTFASRATIVNRINGRVLPGRLRVPGIQDLERHGRFRLTLLTGDHTRKSELETAFCDSGQTLVDVEVVPQLSAFDGGL